MITIKKTGEGYYLAAPAGKRESLGRHECHQIKQELSPIIKPHREITFDLKGVRQIDRGGYEILQDMKLLADHKNCRLKFINPESSIADRISELNRKKVLPLEEMELF